jgi:phospholipase C
MFRHVVVLMLENHSFDRTLGYLQTIGRDIDGVDKAKLGVNPNIAGPDDPAGLPVGQAETAERAVANDPQHDLDNVLHQIANGMAGFVLDYAHRYPTSNRAQRADIMGYYPRGFLPALHKLAEEFVVCDRWFSALPGPTWPNRFFVHSGTSLGHVDMPEGVFTPGVHFYNQRTIYQELETAGVSWRIYYGDFPQSLVLANQLAYPGHYRKMPDFYADAQGSGADFPAYSFIEPTYFVDGQNDQHPPHDVLRGDALIAQVYNALKGNPALFSETLLVILHDEHGGFYDHVVPPPAVPPDDNIDTFAFDRYGVRVPAVLVSPRLDRGELHTDFDHTSLLRFVIENFGLPDMRAMELGRRVAQARPISDGLAVRGTPRADLPEVPVPAADPPKEQPELTAAQQSLVAYSRYLESKIADPALRAPLRDPATADAMFQGPKAQAALAVQRLESFIADRTGAPARHPP